MRGKRWTPDPATFGVAHECPQCGDTTPGLDGWCRRCDAADLNAWEAQLIRLYGADLRREPLPPASEVVL